jgi:hypothetical protein
MVPSRCAVVMTAARRRRVTTAARRPTHRERRQRPTHYGQWRDFYFLNFQPAPKDSYYTSPRPTRNAIDPAEIENERSLRERRKDRVD